MKKNIKFGIAAPLPGVSIENLIKYTVSAEKYGFDSIWFPDHVLFMAKKINPEVWSVITAAAMKTSKIQMGAIGDPHRMHPAILAQRLATVDQISGGRIFMTLGYGEKMNLDAYGIKWDRPLRRVKESVEIIRALWSSESVNYRGRFYKLKNAEIRITPVNKQVPIYISATGPKSLKNAGSLGDGWITIAMPSSLFKKQAKVVNEQFRKAKKGRKKIEKCIYIFTSIANDIDQACSTLEPIKHALIWPELLDRCGYGVKIAKKYSGLKYTKIMPNDSKMLAKFREMGRKYYSRDILVDFVIAGSVQDVRDRIEQYINAGVDHFVFRDFSPDKDKSIKLLSKQIIPYFKN
jgi:alkanesulfonate monooxygenase SsuD/methylene tetrahydromethanopterin reductase-like flavin-dependent oxidoreductase (luciferase family)